MSNPLGVHTPRGARRLIYVSDPSSIARRYLPDPTTEDDLRRWVDDLADAGADTFIQEAYTQGWTTYWRTDDFEYDARPQHRRFLPLLDRGVQPLGVFLDQSRRRGMEFMAGFRINDNHGHVSVDQGVGAGASFLLDNPRWQIQDAPPGPYYRLSTPMDFTFVEVRDFIYSVVERLVRTFDVDGIELCFRDHRYFPPGTGPERQPLMTELVRRIREMVRREGDARRRDLIVGARVYQTVEECHSQGLDVPAWISERLIDYVAPGDVMYADGNAPYEDFVGPARESGCMVYPGMLPWTSLRGRRRWAEKPISADQQRALATNFYGAGADGISFYNHFVPLEWAPFYPAMLQDLERLRSPERVASGDRHYVFDPIWGGSMGFGEGRTSTGALKADAIVLRRGDPRPSGSYRFRICEDVSAARDATLLFRAYHMTDADRIEVRLNGTAIPASSLRRRFDERRTDMAAPTDLSSTKSSGLPQVIEVPSSWSTCWFVLEAPPTVYGDNWLEVTLAGGDPKATEDIGIDEIEVLVTGISASP